ncbi:hypothetical protein KM043_016925 [Ampulex compressa]|nr:hypothetical protein KM043_016925 [Ampulex compressa]
MATAAKVGPQDMPPKGGYKAYQFNRVPLRTIFGARTIFPLYLGVSTLGFLIYAHNYRQIKREKIEMRSARFAILPILLAERDRNILRYMRRNRDEEAELMKNVPGWVVGTYFGEKIYSDATDDTYIEPTFSEYVAHALPSDTFARYYRFMLT